MRLLVFEPDSGTSASLGASREPRTFLGTGGTGTIEAGGQTDDIAGGSVDVAPGASVTVHVPGPDALEIIEIARTA